MHGDMMRVFIMFLRNFEVKESLSDLGVDWDNIEIGLEEVV
jgi:hypothetical protein